MDTNLDFQLDPVNQDDDFNLVALIQQMGHASFTARGRELRQYGLTNMWAAALYVIYACDNNATPTDISRWLLRELHTITGLLGRMEREGYIRRFTDRKRKNQVRVAMTEKGREAYFKSIKRETYHRIMNSLSGEEREAFRATMIKLWRASLEELSSDHSWAKNAASHIIDKQAVPCAHSDAVGCDREDEAGT